MGENNGAPVILVVDDEADLASTCERLLRRRGHRVVTLGSCAEGLAALRGPRPALLVADLKLPDGDGMDLVRSAHAMSPPVPTIVITAHASESSRRAALAAGACAYLPKPFGTADFSRLVEQALGLRRAG